MRKRIISLVTALTLISPYVALAAGDPPAQAEASAQDVLFKNGAKARGQVIDIVPGDHVTLRLKNGEARRFEWKDVDRVIPASGPEPPALPPLATPPPTATTATTAPTTASTVAPTAAPTAAPTQETLPPVTGPTAKVHINSPVAAHLYRKAAGMQTSVRVCDAPCDMEMPISDEYQVAAEGAKTITLHLSAREGQTVVIDVNPPSDFGKIGGVLMIIGGSVVLLVGGVIDLVGLALEGTAGVTNDKSSADSTLIVGLVITGIGLAVGVGGIVILVKSGDTDVAQHAALLGAPKKDVVDDRFVRAPVWHTATPFEQSAKLPTTTIPIFSRSF